MTVALIAGGEGSAVIEVVVAAVVGCERSADVVTRWTAHCRRYVGIALTAVRVTCTVEGIVVAEARRGVVIEQPLWRLIVATDVVARPLRQLR